MVKGTIVLGSSEPVSFDVWFNVGEMKIRVSFFCHCTTYGLGLENVLAILEWEFYNRKILKP